LVRAAFSLEVSCALVALVFVIVVITASSILLITFPHTISKKILKSFPPPVCSARRAVLSGILVYLPLLRILPRLYNLLHTVLNPRRRPTLLIIVSSSAYLLRSCCHGLFTALIFSDSDSVVDWFPSAWEENEAHSL
jgi:hypothetical protein